MGSRPPRRAAGRPLRASEPRSLTLYWVSRALPSHLATLGDGDRDLRCGRNRLSDHSGRDTRARSSRLRQVRRRLRSVSLLPAAARSDDRGGARQVRLPLHRVAGLGAIPPPVRGGARLQARRWRPRDARDLRSGSVREAGLGNRWRRRADADRVDDCARAGSGECRGRRDHPARPLRRAQLVPRRLDGSETHRAGDRLPPRSRRRGSRDGGRAVARDDRDRDRRDRRVPPVPLRAVGAARRGRSCGAGIPLLLDARLVARLGPRHTGHVTRPDGRTDRAGGLFPERAGARHRVRGPFQPGAPRHAHRADPRLRSGPLRPVFGDARGGMSPPPGRRCSSLCPSCGSSCRS